MNDKEFLKLLSTQSRQRFHRIWQAMKSKEPLEGEEKVIGELMLEHLEFHNTWEFADVLAEKEYDPNTEANPFLHITIDSAIMSQIAQKNPPEVGQAYTRLRKRGLSHLDALHEIDRIFVKEFWQVLKYKRGFNNERYAKNVKKL